MYFSFSYFLFPYISSIINPKYIFYINFQYIFIVLLVLIAFLFFYTSAVKLSLNRFKFNIINWNDDSLLLFAYIWPLMPHMNYFNNWVNGLPYLALGIFFYNFNIIKLK